MLRTFAISYHEFKRWRRVAHRNGWHVASVERCWSTGPGVVYVVAYA